MKADEIDNDCRQIHTRFDDDVTKIRIKSQFRKGQCIFSLLNIWNCANSDLRNAGNLFYLKLMLKNEINKELKECAKNDCFSCKIDANRDYSKYMKIWMKLNEKSGLNILLTDGVRCATAAGCFTSDHVEGQ